jgi:hypothetical protein
MGMNTKIDLNRQIHFLKGEGSRLLSSWHGIEFDAVNDYDEVRVWSHEQFGPEYKRWCHIHESIIHFRDEQDAVMFALRWS